MVDGGDSQARTIKEGYEVACDVDFLGSLEGKKHVHISEHLHFKYACYRNQRRNRFRPRSVMVFW
jgi:hypothetical protein